MFPGWWNCLNNETSFRNATLFGEFPEFRAARPIRGGHLQTIAGSFAPIRKKPGNTKQYIVDTTQGDQLVLHMDEPGSGVVKRREVLLVHGLGGSHASPYMIRSAALLVGAGYRVWRFDQRGCGAGIHLARYHAHAGRTEDLQAIVEWIERRANRPPDNMVALTIAGFSLGANILLKWLGNRGSLKTPFVDSAIAVAPPVDLSATSRSLNYGAGRLYDWYFGRMLKRHLLMRRQVRSDLADTRVNPIPGKLAHFDAAFTAPLGGFASLQDYYSKSSSGSDLCKIRTPTMLLYDLSDPIVPGTIFSQFPMGPGIQQVVTTGGGHLGFIARPGLDGTSHWLDCRIRDWIVQLGESKIESAGP